MMKKIRIAYGNLLLVIFVFFSWGEGNGQSFKGVTGVRDSSYSTRSAFEGTRKTHPDISIVGEFIIESIVEERNITYCNQGERALRLDVFRPKTTTSGKIAIIIVHGGGWRSGNRTQHYPMAQKLADLGYVCFTPEYRLSTEALFPAAVFDVKAAIRWVRKNSDSYRIDPNKIAILGFSAGGELAAFMGTTGGMPLFEGSGSCSEEFSSQVNAVIDIDGTLSFVHPESSEGDDSKRISAATNWFGYPKKENPLLWKAASPLGYVSSKTPPTLFLNSAKASMHAGRDDYMAVLDKYGIYNEVHEFKDAPHSFCLFEPWFGPTVKFTADFLFKVLQ